jgi:hypothetical protein
VDVERDGRNRWLITFAQQSRQICVNEMVSRALEDGLQRTVRGWSGLRVERRTERRRAEEATRRRRRIIRWLIDDCEVTVRLRLRDAGIVWTFEVVEVLKVDGRDTVWVDWD